MTISDLRTSDGLLLDIISGSRAYGLQTAHSDTDRKGVYVLPQNKIYGLEFIEQVNNDSNDEVYYELRRFVELLLKNNPNILEMLATPGNCIVYKHPLMQLFTPELFLSKLCRDTFAGYALSQIKKAKGLNKKVVNPVDKEKKSVLDFCYVIQQQGSINLKSWLMKNKFSQQQCGLVSIPHIRDAFALFHQSQLSNNGVLRGIVSGLGANDVCLSPVEKGHKPIAIMGFNKDAYSRYSNDYKEYWNWVDKRNERRYTNTIEQGKNYDAKNMMHTIRLLIMAEEIACDGKLIVRRQDREFLLKIRSGAFSYEELLEIANKKIEDMHQLYEKSGLPDHPDGKKAEELLVEMRCELYKIKQVK